jgi:hypothetical protein
MPLWRDPSSRVGSEGDGLARRVLEPAEILSAPPGGVLLGAAEPVPLDRFIRDQGSDRMDSRPQGEMPADSQSGRAMC